MDCAWSQRSPSPQKNLDTDHVKCNEHGHGAARCQASNKTESGNPLIDLHYSTPRTTFSSPTQHHRSTHDPSNTKPSKITHPFHTTRPDSAPSAFSNQPPKPFLAYHFTQYPRQDRGHQTQTPTEGIELEDASPLARWERETFREGPWNGLRGSSHYQDHGTNREAVRKSTMEEEEGHGSLEAE
ncbi:MAG: hypothetical protein Q9160_003565 [Pyrenula sp. 1 TL-2023]